MSPKFGTSGLRGLVTDLTPDLVAAYVKSFLVTCDHGSALFVAQDLRPSSPAIAAMVMNAARAAGVDTIDCGAIPTPALALASMKASASAVMVTGSHIPADRNGLKFYTPLGELTKTQEAAITSGLTATLNGQGALKHTSVAPDYLARYVNAFGTNALAGLKIGAYTHSTVGRDLMIETFQKLGADVTELGRSDAFIPIDTEAVPHSVRQNLKDWSTGLDAIISMDGDGDRPLLTDENGDVIIGDILGQITARALGARVVVTPVSSNTGVKNMGFENVITTRIGSPFVIEAMQGQTACVGYEANGGFLLGFETNGLAPLMTRDSLLPMITTLVSSKGTPLSDFIAHLPKRFTAADRLQNVPTDQTAALASAIKHDPAKLLASLGLDHVQTDLTDGVRLICTDAIVHLRPSGNAPELRLYVEAETKHRCRDLLTRGLETLKSQLPNV